MMKVFAFSCRPYDEEPLFRLYSERYGMELGSTDSDLTPENCVLAEGSDFVTVLTTPVTSEILDRFKEMGVRAVCTRTIGYDHIDLAHAKDIGIPIANIDYRVDGVAEYTVMMMLMAVRRCNEMILRNRRNDFTLKGLMGRELGSCTVGVIGAGRVGKKVMRLLKPFGCRIVYCNRSPSPEADALAERMPMDDVLAQSDVVTLCLEHNRETDHIMDSSAISRMRDGAILVNTARGPLVDTGALIDALESGRLGGAALDVIEGEFGYYYRDCSGMVIGNGFMDRLRSIDSVILTHHMAFYYESAIDDCVRNAFECFDAIRGGRDIPHRLA